MQLNIEFMKRAFIASLGAVPITLELTFITMVVSSVLGFLLALKKMDKKKNRFVDAYISFVRGTPIVLQILFFYSLLPTTLNYVLNVVLGLGIKVFDIDPIIYAITVFCLNTTAILTEVFRSALSSIGYGQMEAALSVGMTNWQAMRRIIIPQGLISALPNICTTTVNVLKSTSLAYMMTVQDVMAVAKKEASYGYNYIEAYLVVLFIYIILCVVIQLIFREAEIIAAEYKRGRAVTQKTFSRRWSYVKVKKYT